MSHPQLGARLRFDMRDKLIRGEERINDKSLWAARRVWRVNPWARSEITHGVLVGIRNLSEGVVTSHYGEASEYRPDHWVTVYLVAFDIRRNPIYLMPESVQILRGTE